MVPPFSKEGGAAVGAEGGRPSSTSARVVPLFCVTRLESKLHKGSVVSVSFKLRHSSAWKGADTRQALRASETPPYK